MEYFRMIHTILGHLEKLIKPGHIKIYVDGEFDSNQTDFERRSNNIEVAVMATSDIVGYCLLRIVRMIVDRNFELLEYVIDYDKIVDDFPEDSTRAELYRMIFGDLPIMKIIKKMAKCETLYTKSFNIGEPITVTLLGIDNGEVVDIPIEKTIDQIDIWTINRVRTYLNDEQYPADDDGEKDFVPPGAEDIDNSWSPK